MSLGELTTFSLLHFAFCIRVWQKWSAYCQRHSKVATVSHETRVNWRTSDTSPKTRNKEENKCNCVLSSFRACVIVTTVSLAYIGCLSLKSLIQSTARTPEVTIAYFLHLTERERKKWAIHLIVLRIHWQPAAKEEKGELNWPLLNKILTCVTHCTFFLLFLPCLNCLLEKRLGPGELVFLFAKQREQKVSTSVSNKDTSRLLPS